MPNYVTRLYRNIYFLEHAKRYREQNKELIKYKRLRNRREIKEPFIKKYIDIIKSFL